VIDLLERAAAAAPDRAAVVTHESSIDYAALLADARSVAEALPARGIERFAVLDHDAAEVVALLSGASAAAAEACLYPPAEPAEVCDLLTRFDHTVLVTDDPVVAADADVRRIATVVAPADLLETGPDASPRLTADGVLPHLVLTTGTTGAPRGVRHDWRRLLRGVARVQPVGAEERWLLAYGLHQFAGLQLVLHVLAAQATLVAPAPRRPREGLAAMRALGVTHASATPTYWRFLLAELRADGGPVPPLEQITLGGEAVPAPVLDQLRRTFPDAHLSQIYAASEFGSSGSVRDGRSGLAADALRRGDDAEVAMKVVDGELWVRSRTGMLGYYGEPPVDPDAWRPTGDLVEEIDGRIVFRGRTTEVINVGGVKVHPLPVEERVGAVPGVALARVWGRPNKLTGTIVAVDVVPGPGADHAEVAAAVRAACADLAPAARPRSVRIVDDITTRGSKIVRQP
jgi:acyl-CoA synthetase (AMP-forming)/AMP-acid ligase II